MSPLRVPQLQSPLVVDHHVIAMVIAGPGVFSPRYKFDKGLLGLASILEPLGEIKLAIVFGDGPSSRPRRKDPKPRTYDSSPRQHGLSKAHFVLFGHVEDLDAKVWLEEGSSPCTLSDLHRRKEKEDRQCSRVSTLCQDILGDRFHVIFGDGVINTNSHVP